MPGFDNGVMFADNVDFSGTSVSQGTASVTQNGQLLIGSTSTPHIRVGTIAAGSGKTSVTNGAGTIAIDVVPSQIDINGLGNVPLTVSNGGTGVTTFTSRGVLVGQTAGALQTTAAGSAGQVLRSGGAAANPSYSTATYPATAGTAGNVLASDGTNFVSSPTIILTQFTASGTWTRNSRTKVVEVFYWGSGGGGGNGIADSTANGGGGGSAGKFYHTTYSITLPVSGTVTIGAGGTSGGGTGGSSVFASVTLTGGAGGSVGAPAGGAGGAASIYQDNSFFYAPSAGGNGGTATGGTPTGVNFCLAPTAGGGGAGGSVSGTGGNGGGSSFISSVQTGGAGGAGSVAGGAGQDYNLNFFLTPKGATGGGGGGGGVATAGNGGAGGVPGGGGGGGGSATSGGTPGTGGVGGRAEVYIIEYT